MNSVAVENERGLVRDTNSNALLSIDIKAKEQFMKEREQTTNLNKIQTQLNMIQTDMLEIKSMLKNMSELKCVHQSK